MNPLTYMNKINYELLMLCVQKKNSWKQFFFFKERVPYHLSSDQIPILLVPILEQHIWSFHPKSR